MRNRTRSSTPTQPMRPVFSARPALGPTTPREFVPPVTATSWATHPSSLGPTASSQAPFTVCRFHSSFAPALSSFSSLISGASRRRLLGLLVLPDRPSHLPSSGECIFHVDKSAHVADRKRPGQRPEWKPLLPVLLRRGRIPQKGARLQPPARPFGRSRGFASAGQPARLARPARRPRQEDAHELNYKRTSGSLRACSSESAT